MGLLRKKRSHGHKSEKKLQEIIKCQLQFEQNIEIERAHRSGKAMIDGVANKRRTIIAKFLNFKIKHEVLSEYKALMNQRYIYK